MITAVPQVRNIDISGNTHFFERTNSLITKLKARQFPVKLNVLNGSPGKAIEGGFITIELDEPINGIKTGLFKVTDEISFRDPLVHRFTLTASNDSQKVLGLTFTMKHPDFERVLTSQVEALIGRI